MICDCIINPTKKQFKICRDRGGCYFDVDGFDKEINERRKNLEYFIKGEIRKGLDDKLDGR